MLNGRRVIGVGIVRKAKSNTIEISNGVEKAITRIQRRLDNVEIVRISDDARFQLGRREDQAICLVNIDTPAGEHVIQELEALPNIISVRQVHIS